MLKPPRRQRSIRRIFLSAMLFGVAAYLIYFYAPWPVTAAWTSVDEGILVRHDVTYCMGGGTELKMDLYVPPKLEARKAPALLYVHGGGWQSGDKSWVNRIVLPRNLVARGYVVAAIDYRLAPRYKWPAQIEDAKCAVRFLRANAAQYDLDPDRIGVWGESAGGQLVALLGLTDESAGFDGSGGYAEQSSKVQAVVDMFGPTDFASVSQDFGNTLRAMILLGFQPDPEFLKHVSPISYVSADAPPFLIMHGDKDTTVSPEDSRKLYSGLAATGADATLVIAANAEHVFAPAGGVVSPTLTEVNWQVADFFDRTLQPQQATVRTFAETHHTVRGRFLDFWNAHGGIPFPGYPLSEAIREGDKVVQYFERAVLETNDAMDAAISVRSLGELRFAEKYPQRNTSAAAVAGIFTAYWQEHGGAATFGPALAEAFDERQADGSTLRVQYFRNAVFEYHPANAPPNNVLLMPLGALHYQSSP